MKVRYDGEVVGAEIITDRNMMVEEALEYAGFDPYETEGGEPVYDYNLFTLDYDAR